MVPEVTVGHTPLVTLYLILSAFPSLLDVFLGKQHTPEELPATQLLFQTPLLLPQSHQMVPVCPDTVTAVPKLPLASQKLMGPALDTVPRVEVALTVTVVVASIQPGLQLV